MQHPPNHLKSSSKFRSLLMKSILQDDDLEHAHDTENLSEAYDNSNASADDYQMPILRGTIQKKRAKKITGKTCWGANGLKKQNEASRTSNNRSFNDGGVNDNSSYIA